MPVPSGILSNRDPGSMQVLGYTSAQQLLYDADDTGSFFVSTINSASPDWSYGFNDGFGPIPGDIWSVSPANAAAWFASNGLKTIVVYNPFRGAPYPLSTVVGNP